MVLCFQCYKVLTCSLLDDATFSQLFELPETISLEVDEIVDIMINKWLRDHRDRTWLASAGKLQDHLRALLTTSDCCVLDTCSKINICMQTLSDSVNYRNFTMLSNLQWNPPVIHLKGLKTDVVEGSRLSFEPFCDFLRGDVLQKNVQFHVQTNGSWLLWSRALNAFEGVIPLRSYSVSEKLSYKMTFLITVVINTVFPGEVLFERTLRGLVHLNVRHAGDCHSANGSLATNTDSIAVENVPDRWHIRDFQNEVTEDTMLKVPHSKMHKSLRLSSASSSTFIYNRSGNTTCSGEVSKTPTGQSTRTHSASSFSEYPGNPLPNFRVAEPKPDSEENKFLSTGDRVMVHDEHPADRGQPDEGVFNIPAIRSLHGTPRGPGHGQFLSKAQSEQRRSFPLQQKANGNTVSQTRRNVLPSKENLIDNSPSPGKYPIQEMSPNGRTRSVDARKALEVGQVSSALKENTQHGRSEAYHTFWDKGKQIMRPFPVGSLQDYSVTGAVQPQSKELLGSTAHKVCDDSQDLISHDNWSPEISAYEQCRRQAISHVGGSAASIRTAHASKAKADDRRYEYLGPSSNPSYLPGIRDDTKKLDLPYDSQQISISGQSSSAYTRQHSGASSSVCYNTTHALKERKESVRNIHARNSPLHGRVPMKETAGALFGRHLANSNSGERTTTSESCPYSAAGNLSPSHVQYHPVLGYRCDTPMMSTTVRNSSASSNEASASASASSSTTDVPERARRLQQQYQDNYNYFNALKNGKSLEKQRGNDKEGVLDGEEAERRVFEGIFNGYDGSRNASAGETSVGSGMREKGDVSCEEEFSPILKSELKDFSVLNMGRGVL